MLAREPIDVPCPQCKSPTGERCTAPTAGGRRDVEYVHFSRETAANDQNAREQRGELDIS